VDRHRAAAVILIGLAAKQALNVIVRRRRQRRLDAKKPRHASSPRAVKSPDATELLNMPETDADRPGDLYRCPAAVEVAP